LIVLNIHGMPDNTRSLVVLAILHTLENAEKACIVWPNRAITVVCVASLFLSGIQYSCENQGEVDENGEGKELHHDPVTCVGRLDLM
jgi:hypothetical protein